MSIIIIVCVKSVEVLALGNDIGCKRCKSICADGRDAVGPLGEVSTLDEARKKELYKVCIDLRVRDVIFRSYKVGVNIIRLSLVDGVDKGIIAEVSILDGDLFAGFTELVFGGIDPHALAVRTLLKGEIEVGICVLGAGENDLSISVESEGSGKVGCRICKGGVKLKTECGQKRRKHSGDVVKERHEVIGEVDSAVAGGDEGVKCRINAVAAGKQPIKQIVDLGNGIGCRVSGVVNCGSAVLNEELLDRADDKVKGLVAHDVGVALAAVCGGVDFKSVKEDARKHILEHTAHKSVDCVGDKLIEAHFVGLDALASVGLDIYSLDVCAAGCLNGIAAHCGEESLKIGAEDGVRAGLDRLARAVDKRPVDYLLNSVVDRGVACGKSGSVAVDKSLVNGELEPAVEVGKYSLDFARKSILEQTEVKGASNELPKEVLIVGKPIDDHIENIKVGCATGSGIGRVNVSIALDEAGVLIKQVTEGSEEIRKGSKVAVVDAVKEIVKSVDRSVDAGEIQPVDARSALNGGLRDT